MTEHPPNPIISGKPDHLVSVGSVLRNDQDVVEQFVKEVIGLLSETCRYFELVLIDNHSSDETLARLSPLLRELPGVRVIRLSRWQNSEIALSALLDHCIGDFVITLDCRLDPVEIIPDILATLLDGSDVVIGQNQATYISKSRRTLGKFSRRVTSRIVEAELIENTGLCHGFTRRALNAITKIHSKSRFILYDSLVIGYRQTVYRYVQRARKGARLEPEPLFQSFSGRVQMIIAHSLLPLRLAGLLGVLASFANLGYLVYIFGVALFKRRIAEGWITTSLLNTTMFFTLFVILSILAEYLGRILAESKNDPSYFVESESGSAHSTYDQHRLNVVSE